MKASKNATVGTSEPHVFVEKMGVLWYLKGEAKEGFGVAFGGVVLRESNEEQLGYEQVSEDDEKLSNEQTFDSALSAMVTKLEEFIIPFVNEVFGEKFTKNAKVEIRNNKHIVLKTDGSLGRKETDAYIVLSEMIETLITKLYHFECETWYDNSIVVRIAEYTSAIAIDNVETTKDGVILNYPSSVVIFLRPDNSIPRKLKITHRAPTGDELSYEVPTLQIKDFSIDDIFDKKLLILLPFYLFRYVDEFDEMEDNADRRKELENGLQKISDRLSKLVEAKEINVYQQRTTLRLLKRVSDRLTKDFHELREGVDKIMSGYIARTDADDILEQGEMRQAKKTASRMYESGNSIDFISACIGYDANTVAEWLGVKYESTEQMASV